MDLERRIRDEFANIRARQARRGPQHDRIVDGYLGGLLASARSNASHEMPELPTPLNFKGKLPGVEVTEVPRGLTGEAA